MRDATRRHGHDEGKRCRGDQVSSPGVHDVSPYTLEGQLSMALGLYSLPSEALAVKYRN